MKSQQFEDLVINKLLSVKDQLEPGEFDAFLIRVSSLESNIIYWTKRLSHELRSERTEAQFEIDRCKSFLSKVEKDIKKAIQK